MELNLNEEDLCNNQTGFGGYPSEAWLIKEPTFDSESFYSFVSRFYGEPISLKCRQEINDASMRGQAVRPFAMLEHILSQQRL